MLLHEPRKVKSVNQAMGTLFENFLTVIGFPTVSEFWMRSQASRNSICIFTIKFWRKTQFFTTTEPGAAQQVRCFKKNIARKIV